MTAFSHVLCLCASSIVHSSAYDRDRKMKVAIKKLARPFQTAIHAKRAYRELHLLKHMHHENVTASATIVLILSFVAASFWPPVSSGAVSL